MTTMVKEELETTLNNFIGTESYHRIYERPDLKFTDGVKYLVYEYAAFGTALLQVIRSFDYHKNAWASIEMDVKSGQVKITDGNDNMIKELNVGADMAGCMPEMVVKIWMIDTILLLPSEY